MGDDDLDSYVTNGWLAHILRLRETTIRAWAEAVKVTVLGIRAVAGCW
jgi:hypothetical protein